MGSQIVTMGEQSRGSSPLVGMRADFIAVGKEHAKAHGEQMKELLAPHIKLYCDMLVAGVKNGDRTCMRYFPEIVGAVGGKSDMLNALVISVGANSPEHLKSAASTALDAEATDDETAYAQALEFVSQYRRERGLPALVEASGE